MVRFYGLEERFAETISTVPQSVIADCKSQIADLLRKEEKIVAFESLDNDFEVFEDDSGNFAVPTSFLRGARKWVNALEEALTRFKSSQWMRESEGEQW